MAVKTRANFQTDQATAFADNTTGAITPAVLRGQVVDLSDSAVFPGDANAVTTAMITDANVTLAKLANFTGLSVLGRAANTTGVSALITAATDGHVLRLAGTTLGFGTLAAGAFADNTIAPARITTQAANTILGNATASTAAVAAVAVGTNTVVGRVAGNIVAAQLATAQVADDAITYAKVQNVSTNNRLLGRATTGAGDIEEITLGTNLSLTGTTLNATGGLAAIAAQSVLANATGASGVPAAVSLGTSTILGRGPTGNVAGLTVGAGLTITNSEISVGATISGTKTTPVDADAVPIFDSEASNATVTTTVGGLRTRLANLVVDTSLATTGTINLDFAALTGEIVTITLTGNPTFTTSNRVAGRTFELRLAAGGATRTITWPAGWVAFGAALPTSLASGAVMSVALRCLGTADSNIDATHILSV